MFEEWKRRGFRLIWADFACIKEMNRRDFWTGRAKSEFGEIVNISKNSPTHNLYF